MAAAMDIGLAKTGALGKPFRISSGLWPSASAWITHAGCNTAWLIELREALGINDFLAIVHQHLDDDSA